MTNFSQHACRKRYAELQAGTAKPTPESIENPDEHIKARRQSRKDKEKAIEEVGVYAGRVYAENLGANGWTSRTREYQ